MANTPSNRLERLCAVNNREAPDFYDDALGPSHQPVFTVTATVGKFTATASDSVKKRAKHKASNELLKYIVEEARENPGSWEHLETAIEGWDYEKEIQFLQEQTSASQVWRNQFNSIGALSEYCAKNKIFLPKFEDFVLNERPPRFKYVCSIYIATEGSGKEYVTEAEADTKRAAKKKSADLMCELLQKNGYLVANEEKKDNKDEEEDGGVKGSSNSLEKSDDSSENLENSSSNRNMQIQANINTPIEPAHDCDSGDN